MANYSSLSNSTSTSAGLDEEATNHTVTFVIGFGVLMLFLAMGIAASAFLCVTLKKDPYLWPVETYGQEAQGSASPKAAREEILGVECTEI